MEEYNLTKKELEKIIILEMSKRYNLSKKVIQEFYSVDEAEIPLRIFSEGIGSLEAVVKYMKENLEMNYSDIARKLNRDQRTVWTAYNKANKKIDKSFKYEETGMTVPLSILGHKELTVFESVVIYLNDYKKMRYSEIGEVLGKDQRNIWTTQSRARKKYETNV